MSDNSSNGSTDSSNDSLNGSWVKLDSSFKNGNEHPKSVHNGEMEDLLAEAVVDDSRANGSHLNRDSSLPLTPSDVTVTESEISSETKASPLEHVPSDRSWIQDWSSRVEPHPPKKWRLTYPPRREPSSCFEEVQAHHTRKTNLIKINFYIVVPALLVTHVVAFGIGLYLGRHSAAGPASV